MKYVVLAVLIVLSIPAVAKRPVAPFTTLALLTDPPVSQEVTREDVRNYCRAMSLIGEASAIHFQNEGTMNQLLDRFNDDPSGQMSPELRQSVTGIALDAYRLPRHPPGAAREKEIRDFRDGLHQSCMQALYPK